ncbi:UNVERIFIED_CONTAM: Metacaspase-1 [Sesamum latifolium]|uniref:Metacaspase-1 n=1 Tax=Sesamum latifolium TaxID=2727402 RepID=A0AAW2T9U0_9LAMI
MQKRAICMGRPSSSNRHMERHKWGEAISFSGCDDDQTSADTAALSKVTSTGAMTFAFIQAIEKGQATTYGSMLTAMRSTIRRTDEDLGGSGGVVTTLLNAFDWGKWCWAETGATA